MFALFAGYNYYPSGGWDDLIAAYPTLEGAQHARNARKARSRKYDWFYIVDLSKGEVVEPC